MYNFYERSIIKKKRKKNVRKGVKSLCERSEGLSTFSDSLYNNHLVHAIYLFFHSTLENWPIINSN